MSPALIRDAANDSVLVRTGKRTPKYDSRTLQAADYLKALLPRIRASVNNSRSFHGTWGEMGNADYGDCTCAAVGHAIQVASAVEQKGRGQITISDADILAGYWATGKPPGQGIDDNGRFCLDILNYWRSTGFAGHKLHAFAALARPPHLRAAVEHSIDLFGFAYVGVGLPVTAQQQQVWDVVSGPGSEPWSWGGHCIALVDYDRKGPTCVTWGALKKMTWTFLRAYCDESFCAITPEWIDAAGKSARGIDLAALDADLAALRH